MKRIPSRLLLVETAVLALVEVALLSTALSEHAALPCAVRVDTRPDPNTGRRPQSAR